PTSSLYTLSLHDALPISVPDWARSDRGDVHVFGALQGDRHVPDFELPQSPDFLLEHVLCEGHDGREHAGENIRVPVCIATARRRSEEHTSELQSRFDLVC